MDVRIPGEFFPHMVKDYPAVKRFQVLQEGPDLIRLKIVATDHWRPADESSLRAQSAESGRQHGPLRDPARGGDPADALRQTAGRRELMHKGRPPEKLMRLLLITNVFPNRLQPTKGIFNLEMVPRCGRTTRWRWSAPISWTEEWRLRRRDDAESFFWTRRDDLDGIPVHYPRYWHTPRVLRTCYGWFLWHSLRRTLLPLLDRRPPAVILAYWAHPDGAVAVRAAGRSASRALSWSAAATSCS